MAMCSGLVLVIIELVSATLFRWAVGGTTFGIHFNIWRANLSTQQSLRYVSMPSMVAE